MREKILMLIIQAILSVLTPDLIKKFADMVLDFVENQIAASETDVDDKIVLPLLNLLREALNIPDDD